MPNEDTGTTVLNFELAWMAPSPHTLEPTGTAVLQIELT